MASPEKTKEEPIKSDKRSEPKDNREILKCDDFEMKKSVPKLSNAPKADPEELDYTSDDDLKPETINKTSLHLSQQTVQFVERRNQPCIENEEKNKSCLENTCEKGSSKKKKKPNHHISEASSASMERNNSLKSKNTRLSVVAPDGGFGWIVVAAAFIVNVIGDGVTFSFGIMFEEFQEEFGSSSAVTAGVVSMFHAVPLMTGPIAAWLINKYGCQIVTIVGAILAASGFLAAAFSHHIALLYFFFGIIAGFGLSLCDVASVIIVAYYFDRRRSFATGISVCGSGVGTFLFAPLTQWLMDSYDGWRGACIILSGIFLNLIVCGMMFKELNWDMTRKRSAKRSARVVSSKMPEMEELREAIENGDVTFLLTQDDVDEKVASSLITIPNYIKDTYGLSEELRKKEKIYVRKEIKSNDIDKPLLEKPQESIKNIPTMNRSVNARGKNQHLQNYGFRRQSMTYTEACNQINHMKASSCPNIYKNAIVDDKTKEEEDCLSKRYWSMNNCCSLKYLSLPFLVFCFSNFILYYWYDVPYVYTIEYSEKILNVPNSDSTQILSVIGILNTIGEVLVGWLSDQPWISSTTLYAICMCVCGLVTALIPFATSYSLVLVLSAAYGFCISANYSLTSPILVDLVSIDNFSSAYGFLLACQGVGNLIGPPFAGWLYDVSGAWFLTFDLAGVFIAFSGLLLFIIPLFTVFKRYFNKVILNDSTKKKSKSKFSDKSNIEIIDNKDIICDDGCGKPMEV